MRAARRGWGRVRGFCRDDRGGAIVEFQVLGLLLLLPVVYIVLATLDVQRTVYGVTQSAREAGRVAATTGDERLARTAAAVSLRDQGVDPGTTSVSFDCQPDCGESITVVVQTRVPLPYLPETLVQAGGLAIPVSATHVAALDRYAATQP